MIQYLGILMLGNGIYFSGWMYMADTIGSVEAIDAASSTTTT